MLQDVINCKRCGKMFKKTISSYCPVCITTFDAEFKRCRDFLRKRENKTSTIDEMSAQTQVDVDYIIMFIREGRFSSDLLPADLTIPCRQCGRMMKPEKDAICEVCKMNNRKTIRLAEEQAALKKQLSEKAKSSAFFSKDK
jgi:predicted amidophosphoribosyltransferase